jgi:hypothetical protein
MSLVHNERTKLTATWLNTMAAALVTAGIFAPVAAMAYGISDLRADAMITAFVMFGCLGCGLLLHWAGRAALGRLRE